MKVTKEMINAAHDVTMKHKIVLGHELIAEIFEAMSRVKPPKTAERRGHEAIDIALGHMNECLVRHDLSYKRHPSTESERDQLLADIESVKQLLPDEWERCASIVERMGMDGYGTLAIAVHLRSGHGYKG